MGTLTSQRRYDHTSDSGVDYDWLGWFGGCCGGGLEGASVVAMRCRRCASTVAWRSRFGRDLVSPAA